MVFTFARVGAMVAMTVEDYYTQGKRSWLRLQEKGGKQHETPAHHSLEEYLDAYLDAADIAGDRKKPPLPHRPSHHGRTNPQAHPYHRRVADDLPPAHAGRHRDRGGMPQLSGDGDHLLSSKQGNTGKSPADGVPL